MTVSSAPTSAAAVSGSAGTRSPDLRRAPLAKLRGIDYRAAGRDFWADEAALRDRLLASWAGLDDAAWRLPGAAPSDAGGPEWSLHDHVAHIVDWYEIAADYLDRVIAGGGWPNDVDYDGGDFDRFNERRRDRWTPVVPGDVRRRVEAGHARVVDLVRRLPLDAVRADEAWGWVYMVLHGHAIDHLGVIEPWADGLRRRQADGDPFLADPRPFGDGSPAAIGAFWDAEAAASSLFDEIVRPVAPERWNETGPTPDWTLRDHAAHLAAWFEEGADVIDEHSRTGTWRSGPADGLDAWNARQLDTVRTLAPADALARFDAGHRRLRRVVRGMPPAGLTSPEAAEWAYECLHGHVRAHLAMVGPWCARIAWPGSPAARNGEAA